MVVIEPHPATGELSCNIWGDPDEWPEGTYYGPVAIYSCEPCCLAKGLTLTEIYTCVLTTNYHVHDHKKQRCFHIEVYNNGLTYIYFKEEHGAYGDVGSTTRDYTELPKKWADLCL